MSATETREPTGEETGEKKPTGGDRSALVIAVVALAAGLGLVLFGMWGGLGDSGGEGDEAKPDVPTAAVTYEVTGEGRVEVSYLAHSEEGKATVKKDIELPWKETVEVPLGKAPVVSIVLDGEGGQARCALAIKGRHIQSATASGTYGRATCMGELPTPAAGAQ